METAWTQAVEQQQQEIAHARAHTQASRPQLCSKHMRTVQGVYISATCNAQAIIVIMIYSREVRLVQHK